MAPRTKPDVAFALLAHAILATRVQTLEETEFCNGRFGRARDFLMHAETSATVSPGLALTPRQVKELRGDALASMRSVCGACGMCARFGLTPP